MGGMKRHILEICFLHSRVLGEYGYEKHNMALQLIIMERM